MKYNYDDCDSLSDEKRLKLENIVSSYVNECDMRCKKNSEYIDAVCSWHSSEGSSIHETHLRVNLQGNRQDYVTDGIYFKEVEL